MTFAPVGPSRKEPLRRLIPDLEQARAQVALAIDELKRSDSTRLRWQANQAPIGPVQLPGDTGQASA